MKKIINILFLIIILGFMNTAMAATDWASYTNVGRVNTIGSKILTANNLPRGIIFRVSDEDDVNAYANINKEVYVYKGLLSYVENNDELAAVISHEVGHIINGHCAKQTVINTGLNTLANAAAQSANTAGVIALAAGNQLASSKISRNDEMEADLTGVDLLVKAGYNPLAMVSVLNKITGNYLDVFESHPSGEKRLMNIYDYIAYNYPDSVKKGYNTTSYKNALTYINQNVSIRNSNAKEKKKFEKTQEKLKQKKIKRAKKMRNSVNGWDASYAALYLMGN